MLLALLLACSEPPGIGDPEATTTSPATSSAVPETAPAREAPDAPVGFKLPHRLNRVEWTNALREVVGTDLDPGAELPPDEISDGFRNIASALSMSPMHAERIEASVDDVLEEIFRFRAERVAVQVLQAEGPGVAPAGAIVVDDGLEMPPESSVIVPFTVAHDGVYALRSYVAITEPGGRAEVTAVVDEHPPRTFVVETGGFSLFHTLEAELAPGPHTLRLTAGAPDPWRSDDEQTPLADRFEIEGPLDPEYGHTSPLYNQLVPCDGEADPGGCSDIVIPQLARRAWRRPALPEELAPAEDVFLQARLLGLPFDDALRAAFKVILLDPETVYRLEEAADAGDRKPLAGHEVATRMAYFLWSGPPDEALLTAAENLALLDSAERERQVERMLDDPRSAHLAEELVAHWLGIPRVDGITPLPEIYPEWDHALRDAMKEEIRRMADAVVHGDGSVLELFTTTDTWVNRALAEHYDVPFHGDADDEWVRADLSGTARGGVLLTAGWLSAHSHPDRPSMVLRGFGLLEELYCRAPAPPPPEVDTSAVPDANSGSVRAQSLAARGEGTTCYGCHIEMDQLGLLFHGYDAIGAVRGTDVLGHPIDPSATLLDGTRLGSAVDLRDHLVEDEDVQRCATRKILTFALGRHLDAADEPWIDHVHQRAAQDGFSFRAIAEAIVDSPIFLETETPSEGR